MSQANDLSQAFAAVEAACRAHGGPAAPPAPGRSEKADPAAGAISAAFLVLELAQTAEGMTLLRGMAPTAAFAVLVGVDFALEYRPGDLLPAALWGRPDGRPWARVLIASDTYLATIGEHLTQWAATSLAERTAPAVVEAEASLAAAAGLPVVPSSLLAEALTVGAGALAPLVERMRRRED